MIWILTSIGLFVAFAFLYPEDFIRWSQGIRRRIRDDLRRRRTKREWQKIEHEFADL